MVLPFSQAELTESRSFWYGLKVLITVHKLDDNVSLTVENDHVTSDAREVDRTSSYGRSRGEWVLKECEGLW